MGYSPFSQIIKGRHVEKQNWIAGFGNWYNFLLLLLQQQQHGGNGRHYRCDWRRFGDRWRGRCFGDGWRGRRFGDWWRECRWWLGGDRRRWRRSLKWWYFGRWRVDTDIGPGLYKELFSW